MTSSDQEAIDSHREAVRAYAKPGGPLSTDSAYATTRNVEWFRQGAAGPEPRASRVRLHARLVAEAVDAYPNRRQDHRAIVLAGPPGAGKSTVLAEVLGKGRDDWLTVDADEFKRALLLAAVDDGSYELSIKPDVIKERESAGERFYPLELASLVHEESSMLAKQLLSQAMADGTNIVIDTVLSSSATAQQLGRDLAGATRSKLSTWRLPMNSPRNASRTVGNSRTRRLSRPVAGSVADGSPASMPAECMTARPVGHAPKLQLNSLRERPLRSYVSADFEPLTRVHHASQRSTRVAPPVAWI